MKRDVDQLTLDYRPSYLPGDRPALARASDVASSHRAATRAERCGLIESHEDLIVDAVLRYPGIEARQIAEVTGLTMEQVSRRTKQLEVRKGRIHRMRDELGLAVSPLRWVPGPPQ